MSLLRSVEPELLDQMPADDRRAVRARRDLKRNADLIGRNLVSQQDVETAQMQVDTLAAQLDAQEKQQELAQAQIDGAAV